MILNLSCYVTVITSTREEWKPNFPSLCLGDQVTLSGMVSEMIHKCSAMQNLCKSKYASYKFHKYTNDVKITLFTLYVVIIVTQSCGLYAFRILSKLQRWTIGSWMFATSNATELSLCTENMYVSESENVTQDPSRNIRNICFFVFCSIMIVFLFCCPCVVFYYFIYLSFLLCWDNLTNSAPVERQRTDTLLIADWFGPNTLN